jgi:hypothetical protein
LLPELGHPPSERDEPKIEVVEGQQRNPSAINSLQTPQPFSVMAARQLAYQPSGK